MNTRLLTMVAAGLFACQAGAERAEPAKAKARPLTREDAIATKQQARVAIQAELQADSAKVTVRFDQAGEDVEVRAIGAGGLRLTSGDGVLARGLTVAEGQLETYEVNFRPGAGRSSVAVRVRGRFADGERAAVRSFSVGRPSREQLEKAGPTTTIGGEEVKLVPAEQSK